MTTEPQDPSQTAEPPEEQGPSEEQLEQAAKLEKLTNTPHLLKAHNLLEHRLSKAKLLLNTLFKYDLAHPHKTDQLELLAEQLQDVIIQADEPFAIMEDNKLPRKILQVMKRAQRAMLWSSKDNKRKKKSRKR